ALWLQSHMDDLVSAAPWQRVEAVRHALFSSAVAGDPEHLGKGKLRALAALDVGVKLDLKKTPPDNIHFAILKELFGASGSDMASAFSAPAPPTDEQLHMLEVEASQLVLSSPELAKIVGNRDVATDNLGPVDRKSLVN